MALLAPKMLSLGFVFLLLAIVEGTPPGIAKEPKRVKCNNTKFKYCKNLEHVCPKFCPDTCTVDCVSCKPICGTSDPSPPSDDTGSPTPPTTTPSPSPPPPPPTPSTPSMPTPTTPPSTPSTPYPSPPSTPSSPTPSSPSPPPPTTKPSPTPSIASPSPPSTPTTPSSPTPSPPSTPTTPSMPTPSSPSSSNLSPPPPTPTQPSPTPSTPSPSHPSSSPPTSTSGQKRVRCKNKNYTCYGQEHVCPADCSTTCEVDCVTCKPLCRCDYPGSVCQDPRFIGGDGITFYFHGKKEKNFCLLTDPNLHINAHFIGKRSPNMTRDFTWVQSLGILFDSHRLFIGAEKTSKWDESIDRLALTFDNEPIFLQETEGAIWHTTTTPTLSITRTIRDTNSVVLEVEGRFKINAKVVPITEKDSKLHKYGITSDDCLAHLDLGFKFYSLRGNVEGVLGKTYRDDYVSKVNVGAKMPVLGGEFEYESTGLFATDCKVARFNGGGDDHEFKADLGLLGLGLKEFERLLS